MRTRLLSLLALLSLSFPAPAQALVSATEAAQGKAELQIRNLLEPLLDKYCRDECKLMAVHASVDIATPDEVAPGFDDVDPRSKLDLEPSQGRVKILIDEKVGPISRTKLLELVQQYLDTLEFPVKIETQIARFPQPAGSAGRVAELRDKVGRRFRDTVESLFGQFCPEQCLLADFDLQTEAVNAEEAQYGSSGEYVEDAGVAIRIKDISGTILVDESLSPEERANILEMAKLKTGFYKNVSLTARAMKFPRPTRTRDGQLIPGVLRGPAGELVAGSQQSTEKKDSQTSNNTSSNQSSTTQEQKNSTNATNNSNSNSNTRSTEKKDNQSSTSENNQKQEKFERYEKIERVENGDALHQELQQFKVYGLVFACSVLALLIFVAMAAWRARGGADSSGVTRVFNSIASDPVAHPSSASASSESNSSDSAAPTSRNSTIARRYEIERLLEELTGVFAQHPKVAKYVFSRVLVEEGVETTSAYIHLFGEAVVMDMLRDPSLQSDMNELMEFHARNPMEIPDDDRLELLRKLHNRTVAGKLVVMASRSSNLFDFLSDMDGQQILELVRNESLTVKSIVLTQCDPQKRGTIYSQLDEDARMKLMSELSRIDYLPRDFIFNVATALKRKRRDNPKLNTEALPGSEVLLTLLERTGRDMQRTVLRNLELSNPDSARNIKNKLVSLDTLRYLRDGQLLEVILSLKHEELLTFLKGSPEDVRVGIFAKSPKDLVADLEDELQSVSAVTREVYQAIERKVLNRMKVMANEGLLNLVETNDRMLAEQGPGHADDGDGKTRNGTAAIRKVSGW